MLQRKKILTWMMFCLFLFTGYLAANDIDQVYLSTHIWGDKLYRDDFKGHVVVVLMWNFEDIPSKVLCTSFAGYARKYQKEGWVFVGIHTAFGPKGHKVNIGDVWKSARSQRLVFTVSFGGLGSLNDKIKNAPAMLIFDSSGKLVYYYQNDKKQDVNDGFKKMRELLAKEPYWLLGNRKLKYLEREARMIKSAFQNKRNLAFIYKTLDKKKTSGEAKEKEEAIYLATQLNKYLQERKQRMQQLAKIDPAQYQRVYKEFYKLFRGVGVAKDVFQAHDKLVADPGFKKLTRAEQLWTKMQECRYALRPVKYGEELNPAAPKFYQKNSSAINRIRGYFHRYFEKYYKDTPFFKEAEELKNFVEGKGKEK